MPEVFEPGALKYSTLSRLILWILSVPRNPTLSQLSLFGFLDSLPCDLIALSSSLAFFLLMTCALAAALSFSSYKTYSSLSFLPSLSLYFDPYSDYVRLNISLKDFPCSLFLMYMLLLLTLLRSIAKTTPFSPPFFSSPEISLLWRLQLLSYPLRLERYF